MIRGISQECHGILWNIVEYLRNILESRGISTEYHGICMDIIKYLRNIIEYLSNLMTTLQPSAPSAQGLKWADGGN